MERIIVIIIIRHLIKEEMFFQDKTNNKDLTEMDDKYHDKFRHSKTKSDLPQDT